MYMAQRGGGGGGGGAQLSVAPLRREANGLGPLEIDRGHPHVIYSRANPTRNPVTD